MVVSKAIVGRLFIEIGLLHLVMLVNKVLFENVKEINVEVVHHDLLNKGVLELVENLFVLLALEGPLSIVDPVVVKKVFDLNSDVFPDRHALVDVGQKPNPLGQVPLLFVEAPKRYFFEVFQNRDQLVHDQGENHSADE